MSAPQRRQVIEVAGLEHKTPIPTGVRLGNLIFTSALTGRNIETGRYPESVEEQASRAFAKLRMFLDEAGATTEDIAHVRVYMNSLADRPALNKEWLAMFPSADNRPTRHVVVSDIAQFDPLLRMQLEVMIVLPEG